MEKKNGKGKEYYKSGKIKFEEVYLNEKKMDSETNIMKLVALNMKENI